MLLYNHLCGGWFYFYLKIIFLISSWAFHTCIKTILTIHHLLSPYTVTPSWFHVTFLLQKVIHFVLSVHFWVLVQPLILVDLEGAIPFDKTDSSFLRSHLHRSSARVRIYYLLLTSMLECFVAWSCIDLVQPTTAAEILHAACDGGVPFTMIWLLYNA